MLALNGYRKAWAAGLVAVAAWFGTAFPDGITPEEWAALPMSILVSTGIVAAVKNSE